MLEGRPGIKKNGKSTFVKNGRAFITTSQRYKSWEKQATLYLLQEKAKTPLKLPIKGPICLTCKFHFVDHQWECDLSNAYQGIEDILQNIGIIEDDKQIYSHDGSCKIFGSQTDYYKIEITEYVPTKPLHFLPDIE